MLGQARLVLLAAAQVDGLVRLAAEQTTHGTNILRLSEVSLLQHRLLLFDCVHGLAQLATFLENRRHVLDKCGSATALIILQTELAFEVDAPRVDIAIVCYGKTMFRATCNLRDLVLLLAHLHSLISASLIEIKLCRGTVRSIEASRRLLVVDKAINTHKLGHSLLLSLSRLKLIDLLMQLFDSLKVAST